MSAGDDGYGRKRLTIWGRASESEYPSPLSRMAHVLTFSEIIDRSLTATKKLLKTYILGSLALIVLYMILRGVGQGLFVLIAMPALQENLILIILAGIIGFCAFIVSFVLQFCQQCYALVLAVDQTNTIQKTLTKTMKNLWRLLLGGLWMFLRSFTWIAFFALPFFVIGADGSKPSMPMFGGLIILAAFVCALYFFPRLAFINIIQLKDGTGVRASANLSFERTAGYWGKIVGNQFLLMLCFALITAAIAAIVLLLVFMMSTLTQTLSMAMMLALGIPLGIIAVIAGAIYFFAIQLFMVLFAVELYETIKSSPRVKKLA